MSDTRPAGATGAFGTGTFIGGETGASGATGAAPAPAPAGDALAQQWVRATVAWLQTLSGSPLAHSTDVWNDLQQRLPALLAAFRKEMGK